MSGYHEAIDAVANGEWAGLVRSGTPQDTVHRADCRRLGKRVLPWLYAEGKSNDALLASGLKFCKVCQPLLARTPPP